MKKVLSLLLILLLCCLLVCTVVACGEDDAHTCADANNDHKCDICDKELSQCLDGDNDHKCDICDKALSQCLDSDNDHKCDGCGVTTPCVDQDDDHVCDICGEEASHCYDSNNDHLCEICGEICTDCVDDDNDHICDVCDVVVSDCEDSNIDFVCDVCGVELQVTITFYHTMGSKLSQLLNQYITDFNAIYPNITVKHQAVGGYDDVKDRVVREINAGVQPNIAYCYPDHVALYNEAGAVATLDDFIASTEVVTRADGTTETLGLTAEQKADFIQGFYNEGKQFGDDMMYSMPFSKSTEVLYYNKTFFDEHNLTLPTTWAEMEALCAAIKAIDPDCIPLGYDSEANWFITMCEQYGSPYTSAEEGNHFLFNNDTNKGFVKMIREWYDKGYVITQNTYGAYTASLFNGNGSYMCIASSASAHRMCPKKDTSTGEYPFEVGIVSIPQVNPANPKVIAQGPNLCIFEQEDPLEVLASWLFVKFLTTNAEFQTEFSMASGCTPVIKSTVENEDYAEYLAAADGGDHIAALSAKVCLEQASAYFTAPAFNGSGIVSDEVGALLVRCLYERTTDVDKLIDGAFEEAIEECESQIN